MSAERFALSAEHLRCLGSADLVVDDLASLVSTGGLYTWSATSTASDDGGSNALKPNDIPRDAPGRWLRLGSLPNAAWDEGAAWDVSAYDDTSPPN